ncbi:YadA-like family protein [Acinetobacter calcoaceticus]|uniref:ESPR-type extended signal peptide-containing protein n=1 Tax=Acinetobacter calcoaceticus TaxID=471 RepID=UPI00196730EA|nr:ESPR-type extended signal peptide-containing protein [Acinetobacter calcoaceticus]QSB53173.1 YadA-like family protein [Acinetobacter calcoaceticus]
MNKIYRLVWNKSLSLWTVVSENARGVTKNRNVNVIENTNTLVAKSTLFSEKSEQNQFKPTLIALTISSVFFCGSAFAEVNTGGGSSSQASSTAISPTTQQCGGNGQAAVSGHHSVAIGCGTNVSSPNSIGMGLNNRISGTDETFLQQVNDRRGDGSNGVKNLPTGATGAVGASTAVGRGNEITGTGGATVIGNLNKSSDSGFQNTIVGQGNATSGGGYNTALGVGNEVSGSSSAALGVANRARGNTSIAMGRQSYADADYSIAQGNTATVSQAATGGIALGNSATTTGARGIAIGSATGTNNNDSATAPNAAGTESIAIGTGAKATGNQSVAVGRKTAAAGDKSTAVGDTAQALANGDVALGQDAYAKGIVRDGNTYSATAVGRGSHAEGEDALAVGNTAKATANYAGAVGNFAEATGLNSMAVGNSTKSSGDYSSAFGNLAEASGTQSTASGNRAKASGSFSSAYGNLSEASGNQSTALGNLTKATGERSSAVGQGAQAIGKSSVSVGDSAAAREEDTIAVGRGADAKAKGGVAVGAGAVATNADDVALGAGSETTAATGEGYRTGTAAPSSVVSVGTAGNERRIQNLSDGSADTDAVNVRQLKSVQNGVDQLGESTAAGLGGGSTYDPATGKVSNPAYNVNGSKVNNVGDAITELDKGWTLQSNGANAGAVKAGDTVDIGTADGEENLQVAKDGNNIKYSLNRNLKVDSVTAGDSVLNTDGLTIANGPSVTKKGIDAAGNTISNVGPGVAGTDAVNKDQLDQTNKDLTDKGFGLKAQDGSTVQKKLGEAVDVVGADENISTKVQDGKVAVELAKDLKVNSVTAGDSVLNTDGLTIANGPSVTKNGIDAAGKKITNVADGAITPDSKDAINGSQLAKNAQSVSDALGGGSAVNPDGTVSAPNYTVNGSKVNNVGDAITELDKGWTLQSNGANAGAVKAGDTVDIGTADGEENLQVAKDGNNIKYSLNRNLKVDSVTAGDSVLNTDGLTIANGPSVTKKGIDAAGNTISNVGPGVAGTDAVNKDQLDQTNKDLTDKGFGLKAQDGSTVQKKLGEAVDVVGADENISTKVQDGKVAVELAKDLKVNSVTAGDSVLNTDGLTIANGPSVTKNGIDAAGKKITNVADGAITPDSKDAINGSQLAKNAQSVSDALGGGSAVNPDGTVSAPNYTVNGSKVNNVGDAITELDKGWTLQSNGANAGAVKAGDTVDIGTADGEENLQVAKDGNNIKYSLNRNLKVDSVTAGDSVLNTDGLTIANGPSVTKKGIDAAGNTISNVGPGVAGTDAVNKDQLDQTNKDLTDKGFGLKAQDGSTVQKKLGEAVDVVGADENISTKVQDGKVAIELAKDLKVNSVTAGNTRLDNNGIDVKDAVGNTTSIVAGGTIVKDAQGNSTTTTASGSTIKNAQGDSTIINSTGLAFADAAGNPTGPSVGRNGIDAGNQKITGVAPGTVSADSTDAINGSQLHAQGEGVKDIIGGNTKYDPSTGRYTNPDIGGTGKDNINDAIGAVGNVAKAAKTTVSQGDNMVVTETKNADGSTNYKVATAKDVAFDSVKVGNVKVDGATGKITGVTDGAITPDSKDAINGSQLAKNAQSVSDALGGGSAVNPDGTVSAPNYTVNGSKVNNVGDAITELDKGWTLQSNGANAGAVKAGDTVDIGTADGEENLQVAKDGNNIKYSLNRNLKVDSVTAGDSVLNTDGLTIANGPSVTKKGIDAGNQKITGVAPGTVSADSTDAINGSQLHAQGEGVKDIIGGNTKYDPSTGRYTNPDIGGTGKDNINDAIGAVGNVAKAAKTTVSQGDNMVVTETKNADGSTNYKVATAKDVAFDSVKVGNVKVDGATGKITGVTDGAITPDSKDAINGSQLAKNAQSVSDALGGGSAVNPDGTVSAPNYTVNGSKVNNVGDAITELDKGWTLQSNGANAGAVKAGDTVDIGTADGEENLQVAKDGNNIKYSLNRNLKVDSVTAGDSVLNTDGLTIANGPSVTKKGIDAGNQKITGVAPGTVSADSTDAINGSQLHAQGEGVKDIIGGNTKYDPSTGRYTNPDIGGTGKDNINDAIGAVGNVAKAAKTTVDQGDNMVVTETKNADGSTNYKVATAKDVAFDSVKVGNVKVDGATGKITGVTDGAITPDSKDAINGSQLAKNAQSVSDALGGGSAVNPDGTVSAPNYTVNGSKVNNVGDAITELDKGWTLQSNGANAGAVKAGDTVDIGTADGEENLQVAKDGNNIKYSLNRNLKVDSVTAGDSVLNTDGLTIANGPSVTKKGIDAGNQKITGVAPGTVSADSTDAINGSQLHAQGEGVKDIIGGNTKYDPSTGRYTNPDIGGTGKDNINDAIGAVGNVAKAAKTTVSQGDNMVVTETKNADGSTNYKVATAKDVKFDSVTATDEEGNETVLTAKGTQVKDGEGNQAEYGAKGVALKDQDGNGTVLNAGGLGFVDPMGNNIGPTITAKGIDAGNTVIRGVAPGRVAADSQDAINGSQLHGVSDSVKNIIGGNTTVNPDGTLSGSNIGGTGKDNINDAIGAVGDAATKAKSTVSDGKNIVVTEGKNADGSTNYKVETSPDLDVDSVTAGDTKVDGDGLHIKDGPNVTKDGIDAGNKKVTGVDDGVVAKGSKDAVNGGQLKGVSDSVAGAIGGNTTVNPDGSITTSDIGGTGKDNINDAIASVKNDVKGAKTSVSNKDKNITVKQGKNADGSTDYEVGLAKDIAVDSVKAKKVDADEVNAGQVNVTGDKGSTTITGGGISITGPKGEAGPSMTTDGINAGGKKVTGIADGAIAKDSKDGINGGQLHQSYQDVGAALGGGAGYDPEKGWKGPSYNVAGGNYNNVGDALGAIDDRVTNLGDQLEQAFNDTNKRMDKLEDKMSAGIAATAALENAPFVPGKLTMAAGAAYYNDQSAIGVTFRRTSDNGRWSLTSGAAMGSQGNSPLVRVGISGVID